MLIKDAGDTVPDDDVPDDVTGAASSQLVDGDNNRRCIKGFPMSLSLWPDAVKDKVGDGLMTLNVGG